MRSSPSSAQSAAAQTARVTGLAALLLVAACQQHSAAWDDAWAHCDATATEQQEWAEPRHGQVATWRERYIGACMQAKGFHDPQYLIK
jgi:hypothetical protein